MPSTTGGRHPNPNNRPTGPTEGEAPKTTSPLPGIPASKIGQCGACQYGAPRSYYSGGHRGVDIPAPVGQDVVAPVSGEVICADSAWYNRSSTGKGKILVTIKADEAHGNIPAGAAYGLGHLDEMFVRVGQRVEAGTKVGTIGDLSGVDHLHFFIYVNGRGGSSRGPCDNGNVDPTSWVRAAMSGEQAPTTGGEGAGGGEDGGGPSAEDAERFGKAAAFSAYMELPGLFDTFESFALSGEKSLMNDKPLLPFVQQLCKASLRSFQSMPNGNFYAFCPDYFGGLNHRNPYWVIEDIEIIDGQINLSDDALATHVYVVGDIAGFFDGVDVFDRAQTGGVVTIFNAFLADFLNKPRKTVGSDIRTLKERDQAIDFIKKYGARPYYDEAPMVRSPFYEMFLAYQTFCLMWSRQFLSTFTLTFMPELYPGGIVALPNHGIQMYVDEVSHLFDYETGFQTIVNFSAPAALPSSGRQTVHGGMIRAFSVGGEGNR